jgi:hypothetical protein
MGPSKRVEENPRPETYRALLEAQSELQRHDLSYDWCVRCPLVPPMLRRESKKTAAFDVALHAGSPIRLVAALEDLRREPRRATREGMKRRGSVAPLLASTRDEGPLSQRGSSPRRSCMLSSSQRRLPL